MARASSGAILIVIVGFGFTALYILYSLAEVKTEEDEVEISIPETVPWNDDIVSHEAVVFPAVREKVLAIGGRLTDGGLDPLGEVDLFCGSERIEIGKDGRFQFPPIPRHGPVPVSVRRRGEELARWDDVTVGATPAGPPGTTPARKPWSLNWSLCLPGDTLGASPASGASGASTDAPPLPPDFLTVDSVLVEEWGRGGAVHVNGRTRLPDGAQLHVAIFFEDERKVSGGEAALVDDGAYQFRFRLPENFRFYASTYHLRVFFGTSLQDYLRMEQWKVDRPDIPWAQLVDYEVTQRIYVGYPERELEDNKKIQVYYDAALANFERLYKLFRHQVWKTDRLDKGWDPQLLVSREAHSESWVMDGVMGPERKFYEVEWREFLDQHFRPNTNRYLNEHRRWTLDKYSVADFRMERLWTNLLSFTRQHSILLYKRFGLPIHAKDFYRDQDSYESDLGLTRSQIEDDLAVLQMYRKLVP